MLFTDLILPMLTLVAGYFLRSRGPLLPGPATPPSPLLPPVSPATPGLPFQLGDGTILALVLKLLEKKRERQYAAELQEALETVTKT